MEGGSREYGRWCIVQHLVAVSSSTHGTRVPTGIVLAGVELLL
jgi:hypothetical protein